LLGGEQGCGTEFSDVCQYRHLYRIDKLLILLEFGHGFRKYHIGAGSDTGLCTLDRGVHAFYRERVGARHDDKIFIATRIHRGLDAVDHFGA
jgi:hypothetical protein